MACRPNVPMLDTETNDHGGEAAADIFGALWLADSFGGFLTAGGQSTHYYHDLPYSPPHPACANSWGTYHMFMVDKHYQIRQRISQFFAAQLITQEWAEPKDAEHKLFVALSDVKDSRGHVLVTAYALQRPDGQWSLMLINKDHDNPQPVHIVFHDADSNQNQLFARSGHVHYVREGPVPMAPKPPERLRRSGRSAGDLYDCRERKHDLHPASRFAHRRARQTRRSSQGQRTGKMKYL